MRSKIKATAPIRQAAADGPDVIQEGIRDFAAYCDGRYLCSRSNEQDAWIEARQAHFANLEADRYVSADIAADLAELGEVVDAYAAEYGCALTVARGRLAGELANFCADWDEWAAGFRAPAYRQIGAA